MWFCILSGRSVCISQMSFCNCMHILLIYTKIWSYLRSFCISEVPCFSRDITTTLFPTEASFPCDVWGLRSKLASTRGPCSGTSLDCRWRFQAVRLPSHGQTENYKWHFLNRFPKLCRMQLPVTNPSCTTLTTTSISINHRTATEFTTLSHL